MKLIPGCRFKWWPNFGTQHRLKRLLNKGPLVYSHWLGVGSSVSGSGSIVSNKAHCVSGAGLLTNLIQIFRWPDKGYSPPVPLLITTAIPLACLDTRSAPHETSPSSSGWHVAAWKTATELHQGAWEATLLHQSPPSPSSVSGTDLEPIEQEAIFKRQAPTPGYRNATYRWMHYKNWIPGAQPFRSSGHSRHYSQIPNMAIQLYQRF